MEKANGNYVQNLVKHSFYALFFGLLLSLGGTAQSAIVMGWYRFDDPTNLGRDYSGNNNNGTVINDGAAPVYTADGFTGGAADFRGGGLCALIHRSPGR